MSLIQRCPYFRGVLLEGFRGIECLVTYPGAREWGYGAPRAIMSWEAGLAESESSHITERTRDATSARRLLSCLRTGRENTSKKYTERNRMIRTLTAMEQGSNYAYP